MRRISIYGFSLLIFIAGCATDPIVFRGPYFVRFSESQTTIKESFSKPIEIAVHNAGPALDEDILISYSVTGNARPGVDFTISGTPGQIIIPKGEFFGSVEIHLINNSNNIIRSQDLILTLQSVNANLKIGQGESAMGNVFTFTILDDCILGGNYIAERGSASDDVTLTSSDCANYLLSNWNINVFTTSTEMDLLFIDNGDNTLTIPEQEEETIDPDFSTIMGSGVVDPVTRQIILTITLVDYVGQPVITITLIAD